MGKASRWFRGLLGMKKTDSTSTTATASPSPSHKDKRRWSFVKSHTHRDRHYDHPLSNGNGTSNSPATVPDNKEHAIAVAAATAAVAEAAVAAAHAAAAVVRLTSNSGRCADAGGVTIRQQWAAVKIQAAFRGSLARKALRALKGLVKLQALVRGHIERKRTAEWLKRMQALLQAQARVSAGWTPQISHSSTAKLSSNINSPATPEKFESPIRSKSVKYEQSPVLKRNGSKSCVQINGNQEKRGNISTESQGRSLTRTHSTNDDRSDRILETDTGNSHFTSKRRNLFHSTSHHSKSLSYTTKESTSLQSGQSSSYCEVEESPFCTANNSPQYLSATSKDETFKRSPFTPTKSDGSRSCYLRGYSDYPSYMACTESSKAKARSLSAPKQRPPQHERSYSSSSTRYSLNVYDMSRLASQRASTIHSSFTNKAYPGSGRLDRLGMPVGYKY